MMQFDTPFRAWRRRMRLTQARVAVIFRRSKRYVEMLDKATDIPREIALACKWLEAHPEELQDEADREEIAGTLP